MAHVTAFLIVLTLTGEPVAHALCISKCGLPAETQTCDDAIAPSTAPHLAVPDRGCTALLAVAPFLNEGRKTFRIDAMLHVPAIAASPTRDTRLVDSGRGGDGNAGRPAPPLVLRV